MAKVEPLAPPVVEPPAPLAEEVALAALEGCGPMAALELAPVQGGLGAAEAACLGEAMRDTSLRQTERDKLGRVRLVNDHAVCLGGGDCSAHETTQRYFFAEVDRSDAEMLYGWTRYLYDHRDPNDLDAAQDLLLWSDRTLELKAQWESVRHVERVDSLLHVRARVAYERWARAETLADDRAEKYRMRAQADAIEWLNYRRQLGRDDSEPRGLCVSVTSESVCDRFADDDQAPIELTLVSVPLGAQVLVDGEAVGKTPMTHVLSVERHAIRMEKGEDFVEKQISVGVDEPIRYTWRAKDASWTPGY